jgi:membrane-bound lytic murein transglycosylase MltF
MVAMYRKYGAQYNLDWMMMAVQDFQESRLDQNARSQVGAIGVKYVRYMVDKMLFTFAAYNAGPGRVRQLRREAETAAVEGSMKFFAKRQAVCYS